MNWLHYLIEANIYLLVFYVCYRLLLANNTHYTLGRVYLILSCVMAFFIPFTQISILKPATDTVKQAVTQASYVVPTTIKNNQPLNDTSFEFTADDLLTYLYTGGAFVASIILAVRLSRLFSITKSGKALRHGNYQRIDLPDSQTAFSFFNYLYIGTGLKQPETIIAHELVHIRQKHTLDILFLELLKIINWFSPVVYLVQQSLKTVHEYIADEQTAAQENDALSYSSFLLHNAYGLPGASVTHSFFNNNLLKRRIIMLNQKRSGKLARLKYLAALPLCAGMLCTSTLLFSKDYGLIDFAPAKKQASPTLQIDSGKYTLKVTDLKNDIVAIADEMEFIDKKNNKKTTFSVKNFPDQPQKIQADDHEMLIEKVLRDTATLGKNKKQLPPPPPPPAIKRTQNTPPPPPAIKKNKSIQPPPPPPTVTSIKWMGQDQSEGLKEFYKFIGKHVRYPSVAREKGTTGLVIVNFDVKNKQIANIKVLKGILPIADNEVTRVLALYDQKLDVPAGNYNIPVSFNLEGEDGQFVKPNDDDATIASQMLKNGKGTTLNKVTVVGYKTKS